MLTAMDMRDVLSRTRQLMAEITGIAHAYGAGDNDEHALPEGINEPPAVLVLPGDLIEYIQYAGAAHRRTYEVIVQVLIGANGNLTAAYDSIPYIDAIQDKFAANVTLGTRANYIRLTDCKWVGGERELSYGGIGYVGWLLVFEVSEEAHITFAGGTL